MKIIVIGGTGLIGSQVVQLLRAGGHEALAASPSTGVDTLTGHGLSEAMAGAAVVVDVANAPSFADGPVLDFFERAGRNIAAAEIAAGVKHHVVLSVVGTERLLGSGYFRAKLVQEDAIRASGIPFTIVRATQFFEFVAAIADGATDGDIVRLPDAMIQPIASGDVATVMARVALQAPTDGMIEVAGPDRLTMIQFVSAWLAARNDRRRPVIDPSATYFGVPLQSLSLVPADDAEITPAGFADWLAGMTVAA